MTNDRIRQKAIILFHVAISDEVIAEWRTVSVRTLRMIARHENARLSSPIMIVAAGVAPEWDISVWQWRPTWLKVKSGPAPAFLRKY